MHDIKKIRKFPAAFDDAMRRRGIDPIADTLIVKDDLRRGLILEYEKVRAECRGTTDHEVLRRRREELRNFERDIDVATDDVRNAMAAIPNLPADETPENLVVVRNVGEPTKFDFPVKDHVELLGADYRAETATKLAGARLPMLTGPAARLERALGQFALDRFVNFGFLEVYPPFIVNECAMFGTGQLPKFADDLFTTTDGRWLIPTAEVPLTNVVMGDIIDAAELPLRFTALTPCFRAEAGAAGRDTRGLMRNHQFNKVEAVAITTPENVDVRLHEILWTTEGILRDLRIPYRVVELPANDLGFAARRTFDIEAWFPGQGRYREVGSITDCGDFQARRMNGRFKRKIGKPEFLRTINGTGMATGRVLAAAVENWQNEDGTYTVPEGVFR